MADKIIFDENCKHNWIKRESKYNGIVLAKWDLCTKCNSEKNRQIRGVDF